MITVKTVVNAPIEKVWECWTKPEHITKWNFASDDWEAPTAENDLRVGGKFTYAMAAKDKSAAFDMAGEYTNVVEGKLIEYIFGGRQAKIVFETVPEGVLVVESFDPENENSEEMQRAGWQAILDNFKKHVERV